MAEPPNRGERLMDAVTNLSEGRRSFLSTKSFVRGILLGIGISLLISVLSYLGVLSSWENQAFDFMMWWQKERRSTEIFLIEIDSQDYKDLFGSVSPLSRRTLSRLLDRLALTRPRAICLDVSLRDRTGEDHFLIETLRRLEAMRIPVVVASSIQKTVAGQGLVDTFSLDFPYPAPDNVLFGATNFPISEGETIRDMRLLGTTDDGWAHPFIPLSIVAASERQSWPAFQRALARAAGSGDLGGDMPEKLGDLLRTGLRSPRQKIYFIGDKASFNALRFSDLDRMPAESFRPGSLLSDKILLIGGTFTESKDFYRTPKGVLSGVEIIANATETLLTSKPIRPINHLLSLLFEFMIVLALSFMFLRFPLGKATLMSAVSIVPLSIVGSQLAFATMSRWLDFLPVALAVFFHGEASLIEHYRDMKKEIRDLRSRLQQRERELSEALLQTPRPDSPAPEHPRTGG
jgi:CHASE2 domain-containing sensor protein